jgi:ribose 5-phosphate isomerase B
MKIAIASDHAGFEYKKALLLWLNELEFQVLDFGTYSEERVDYPDYAFPAAEAVAGGIADFGILICGTGIGVSITANKVQGIRAANCCSIEMAQLAREHNNANIITLGARLIDIEFAKEMIQTFIYTEFEGDRHMIRIEKIHGLTGV